MWAACLCEAAGATLQFGVSLTSQPVSVCCSHHNHYSGSHRTARMRKYRTPIMVMPMRTYRALWIIELSTLKPWIGPPWLLPPLCVEFPPCVEFVTAGLGAAVLPVGGPVASSAAAMNTQTIGTRTAESSLLEAMLHPETVWTTEERRGQLWPGTGAGAGVYQVHVAVCESASAGVDIK